MAKRLAVIGAAAGMSLAVGVVCALWLLRPLYENPVIGMRGDIDAVRAMLAQSARAGRAGRPSFKVTCVDRRQSMRGLPCDGMGFLTQVDLQRMHQVAANEPSDSEANGDGDYWTQMVFFDPGRHRNGCRFQTLLFEITHGPGRASRSVQAIDISRDCVF